MSAKIKVHWQKGFKNAHLNWIELYLNRIPCVGEFISLLLAVPGDTREVYCEVVKVIHYPDRMFAGDISAVVFLRPEMEPADFYKTIPIGSKEGEDYE